MRIGVFLPRSHRIRRSIIAGAPIFVRAVAYLPRIIYGMSFRINELTVPMFVSWLGFTIPATIDGALDRSEESPE
jgi:hypothetical protein